MTKKIINILTLSKGRMKAEAEQVFKKNKLKIIQESERSLIGSIKGYPNIRVLYMNATEIIEALGKGIGDIGISGKDLWLESEQSIQSKISLVKEYNKPILNKPHKKMFDLETLKKMENSLEKVALSKHPQLRFMKSYLEKFLNPVFVRMTGSGSALVAYFQSNAKCESAKKRFIKKYKNYWCIASKTI